MRRLLAVGALIVSAATVLRYGTRRVPPGMDTLPDAPPGSLCIVDRWARGLRVGSEVFIDTPVGELLSRVASISDEGLRIEHRSASRWPDSRSFGALPPDRVQSVVMVVLQAGPGNAR